MTLEDKRKPASISTNENIAPAWRAFVYENLGTIAGDLAETLFGCEVSSESENHLSAFNAHLKDNSGVVYFNHINLLDGPLVATFLMQKLGGSRGNLKILGGPESRKHFDFSRSLWAPILHLAPLLGLEFTPVVQSYDFVSYSRDERRQLLYKFRLTASRIFSQPGGVIIIAPEETRSYDGTLQPAKEGLAYLRKYGENLRYLPLAIIPKGDFNRDLKLGRVEIKTGNPFPIEEVTTPESPYQRLVDPMMHKLAALLPQHMQGIYQKAA